MKNVTIALDDETYRAARVRAAELGTSVSALVKNYLQGLSQGQAPSGVREMSMSFAAEPSANGAALVKEGPPWLVDGEWVYTKDGKPRKPGALRGMWVADDFGEWPDGFIDAVYGEDTPVSDTWWQNASDVLKKPKHK
jgi:plasmid stability protein